MINFNSIPIYLDVESSGMGTHKHDDNLYGNNIFTKSHPP